VIAARYKDHVSQLQTNYESALLSVFEEQPPDGVLLYSGSEQHYYADDRGIAFQAYGHFLHWIDVNRPGQMLCIRPGHKPVYYQVIPDDYWYEQDIVSDPAWGDCFEVVRLTSETALIEQIAGNYAFLGNHRALAEALGVPDALTNPQALLACLDYQRAYKTDYELDQLRVANRLALVGHSAARECFLAGGSEYDIHMAYLTTCGVLEDETPYTNIVALNEKAAILHYQNKRRQHQGGNRVLLIDAGYRVRGYGSDITRTSVSKDIHPVFNALLAGMESIKDKLVATVRPGLSYVDLHLTALAEIAELLTHVAICRGTASELLEQEIVHRFMPHGVGHLLGIQVHDVAGHQQNLRGDILAPPAHSPMLRHTRQCAESMVFTIEPGCYFIPLLLETERQSDRSGTYNWDLIEQLYPLGGIRIEDNVCVTADGVENLTSAT